MFLAHYPPDIQVQKCKFCIPVFQGVLEVRPQGFNKVHGKSLDIRALGGKGILELGGGY